MIHDEKKRNEIHKNSVNLGEYCVLCTVYPPPVYVYI